MTKSKKRRNKRDRTNPFERLTPREQAILQNWQTTHGLAPKLTAIVEDSAMTTVYERLAKGEYTAIKDGTRTKITTESILARRARLPAARYKPLTARVDA